MLRELRITPKGVVYAGAHHGEHMPELVGCGFEQVLLIEPNEEAWAKLEPQTNDKVRLVRAALNERSGPVAYWAAPDRFDILNSIYEPHPDHVERLRGEKSDALRFQRREVPGVTLDELLESDATPYNFLYMNIQGAVLAAVRGAERALRRFEVIACEVELVSRYKDAGLFDELEPHLAARGFPLAGLWRSDDPVSNYGMACFARRNS